MKKKDLISKVLFFNALSIIMIMVFITVGASCNSSGLDDGNSPANPTNEIKNLRSEKSRDDSPGISEYEWQELVKGNTDFTLEFYHNIASGNSDNIFFSPHSISLALAMAYAGARNQTERQMADTLNFTLQDDLHPAFNYLDTELASRGNIQDNKGDRFRLTVDNSLWGQADYDFVPRFLDVLAVNYGAGLKLLDFSKAPESSRVAINNWISKQTNGKIENLLQKGAISSDTRFVLTNTIYFKASWKLPFEEKLTRNVQFSLLDGAKVTVPMMSKKHYFNYARGNGYQAVELEYYGEELSMVIILPETGYFKMFEDSLNTLKLDLILKSLQEELIQLEMPKFTYESGSASLKESLKEMGMQAAFKPCSGFTSSECSDFSGMDGTRNLFISDVVHKAFISVDEKGTEAAAATGIPGPGSSGITPIPVKIDHPFIFFIRDIKTEAILFMGRIMNPAPGDFT